MRAKDQAGNTDATPETRNWTVDRSAPQTTLASSGPSGRTNSTSAAFSYSSEAGASFECKLDRPGNPGSLAACPASGQSYSDLTTDGDYSFSVRATDQAGNTDATPETRNWTVDRSAPQTTLASSGPSGRTNSTSAAFSYSSEAGASFECKLDRPGNPGSLPPARPRQSYSDLTTDGDYSFSVRAKDEAGNTDATPETRSWTVDRSEPQTTLAPSGPSGRTNSTSAAFSYSSEAGASFRVQARPPGQPRQPRPPARPPARATAT